MEFAPEVIKYITRLEKMPDVSGEQINKHNDLSFGYKPKKTGRAIKYFIFKIKGKNAKPKHKTLPDQQLRERLKTRGPQRIDDITEEF